MASEKRAGTDRRYYYRKQRRGSKIKSIYCGPETSEGGQEAALRDKLRHAQRGALAALEQYSSIAADVGASRSPDQMVAAEVAAMATEQALLEWQRLLTAAVSKKGSRPFL